MKPLALSTMFAQQSRFDDGAAFARFAAESGYDAIEVSHSTSAVKWQQILASGILPITSVHQPAPWVKHHDGRGNSHCNLASLDPAERESAVAYAKTSIGWAAELGADRIVVHLGAVTDLPDMLPDEFRMRRMFDGGEASLPEFAERRAAAIEARAAQAEPYVAAARRSLLELVESARPHQITIGIENRYHFHEIPHPVEYDVILDGFDLSEAGYWHDVGHAEVLHRLGFIDRHAWLDALSNRCVGAHLHDVIGLGDHRSPGDGDVDWAYVVAGLKHLPSYTLEINQHQTDDRAAAAPAFLASIGLR
ncbi:MAG: sugar phosphate isomerase/epimerase family protein [Tepidiformaceae bacterium]